MFDCGSWNRVSLPIVMNLRFKGLADGFVDGSNASTVTVDKVVRELFIQP